MKKLISNSPIPLYYQLREIIRAKILDEDWPYGTEIPSELRLCDEYNLCRATVKQALDGLVNEGLIVRKKGKGSFVVYQKIGENFLVEPSLRRSSGNETMKDYAAVLLADFVEPDSRIAKAFGLSTGAQALRIERLHYLAGEPMALETFVIKEQWSQGLLEESLSDLVIFKHIENTYEASFEYYRAAVKAAPLDRYEAEQLGFPPAGCGLTVEYLANMHGEPAVFHRRIYRSDRCDLCLEFMVANQKMELTQSEVRITCPDACDVDALPYINSN